MDDLWLLDTTPPVVPTDRERKILAIQLHFVNLHRLRGTALEAHLTPTAVVLPAELDPGPDPDSPRPDRRAPTLMGLPIIWGDRAGLVIEP